VQSTSRNEVDGFSIIGRAAEIGADEKVLAAITKNGCSSLQENITVSKQLSIRYLWVFHERSKDGKAGLKIVVKDLERPRIHLNAVPLLPAYPDSTDELIVGGISSLPQA
jgi:hypothetical protein